MIVTITAFVSVVLLITGSYLFLTASGGFTNRQYIIGLLFYILGLVFGLPILFSTG